VADITSDPWFWVFCMLAVALCFPVGRGARASLVQFAGRGPRALKAAQVACSKQYLSGWAWLAARQQISELRDKDRADELLRRVDL
jgi:hypothetical protein